MTVKQLQTLIAAGVFSASLMSGAAYAADEGTTPAKTKHARKHKKEMAKHACAGQNSCKGHGYLLMSKADCDAAKAKMTSEEKK